MLAKAKIANLSRRTKFTLVWAVATIALLVIQAAIVLTLTEEQEKDFVHRLIDDDINLMLMHYRHDPGLLPPFDAVANGYVVASDVSVDLIRAQLAPLSMGVHELFRGLHVAVEPFGAHRLYRVYDFTATEDHLHDCVGLLLLATTMLTLLTLGVAFVLSSLMTRQVADISKQVNEMTSDNLRVPIPEHFDEKEVMSLVRALNGHHRRMYAAIEQEKEFSSAASHELRTPLTTIMTGCELLSSEDSLTPKTRQRVESIEQAALRMQQLIEGLLLLTRPQMAEPQTAVSLRSCVDACIEPLQAAIAQRLLTIDNRVTAEITLRCNRDALMVVLGNVVRNAVKYTQRGSILISYQDGRLDVEDTGVGIEPHELERVFDRFYRGASAEGTRGLGLGLAIVRRVCEQCGWDVTLRSKPGRGTCVSIEIPTPEGVPTKPSHNFDIAFDGA